MLDAAYTLLGNVHVGGSLELDTPDGGRIHLHEGTEAQLILACDSEHSLWELFDLARSLDLVSVDANSLKQLRNPMLQTVEVVVDGRTLINWPGKKLPKVKSWLGLISLLGRRRN